MDLLDCLENPDLGLPMTILIEKTSQWPRPCCALPIAACCLCLHTKVAPEAFAQESTPQAEDHDSCYMLAAIVSFNESSWMMRISKVQFAIAFCLCLYL